MLELEHDVRAGRGGAVVLAAGVAHTAGRQTLRAGLRALPGACTMSMDPQGSIYRPEY